MYGLSESKTSFAVVIENLRNRTNVSCRTNIESEIVFIRYGHNLPRRLLHRVGETRMHNVFLRGSAHAGQELVGRSNRDVALLLSESSLQRLLNRLQQVVVRVLFVLERETAETDVV